MRGAIRRSRLLALVREDFATIQTRDPSRRSALEAALHAPWHGLLLYRVAHEVHRRDHRVAAAALTLVGRMLSGAEIHPGATIGRRPFIDHGFGVVIGETAEIGDDVTLYHRVTLGSRGWWRDADRSVRRHPRLGDRVSVGCGASILGPLSVASDAHVPAHALLIGDGATSLPGPHSRNKAGDAAPLAAASNAQRSAQPGHA